MFLSTTSGEPDPVDRAALAVARPPPPAASSLRSWSCRAITAARRDRSSPADLAQQRLTLAARWLQLAASAISTADALIALGIALETIAGDEVRGRVVERITKRAAIFLSVGSPADDREDVYYEELERAEEAL